MEKYGVLTEDQNKTASEAKEKVFCPKCGKEALVLGPVFQCPKCGTEPFEPRNKSRQNK